MTLFLKTMCRLLLIAWLLASSQSYAISRQTTPGRLAAIPLNKQDFGNVELQKAQDDMYTIELHTDKAPPLAFPDEYGRQAPLQQQAMQQLWLDNSNNHQQKVFLSFRQPIEKTELADNGNAYVLTVYFENSFEKIRLDILSHQPRALWDVDSAAALEQIEKEITQKRWQKAESQLEMLTAFQGVGPWALLRKADVLLQSSKNEDLCPLYKEVVAKYSPRSAAVLARLRLFQLGCQSIDGQSKLWREILARKNGDDIEGNYLRKEFIRITNYISDPEDLQQLLILGPELIEPQRWQALANRFARLSEPLKRIEGLSLIVPQTPLKNRPAMRLLESYWQQALCMLDADGMDLVDPFKRLYPAKQQSKVSLKKIPRKVSSHPELTSSAIPGAIDANTVANNTNNIDPLNAANTALASNANASLALPAVWIARECLSQEVQAFTEPSIDPNSAVSGPALIKQLEQRLEKMMTKIATQHQETSQAPSAQEP